MIDQLLSSNVYQALVNASSPSAINPYITASVITSGYVPYIGATSNLNLGTFSLTAGLITTPLIIGGTGANQVLTFQNTTGATTSAGGAYLFKAGNLGSDLITINQGNFIFSPINATAGAITSFTFTTPANTSQTASTEISNFKVNGASKTWAAGAITTQRWNYFTANTAAFASASTITNSYGLFVEAATAGTNATITNNYALGLNGDISLEGGNRIIRGSNSIEIIHGAGSNYRVYTGSTLRVDRTPTSVSYYNGTATSGAVVGYLFTSSSNTGQTASTNIPGFLFTTGSRQWATGAITTQEEVRITSPTYSFVGASTITNAYTLFVNSPTAGTNATITNNYAAGFNGNVILNTSSARLWLGDMAVSSTNYALGYTATNEISLNSGAIGRIRSAGTIVASWSSTDFTVNGSGGLVISNTSYDGKIVMTRTSGNTHSLQLNAGGYFMYNNTVGAVRYGVTNAGNFYVGDTSSLATTARDGFLYLPSCAGVPTGVPTAITGKVPIVVDSTNNKAYIYSGGAWVPAN